MIQPASRSPRQLPPLSIVTFLGVDITGTRDLRRSPDMRNCVLDDEGTPEMRTGYEKKFATSLGPGKILGTHMWSDTVMLIHHGDKLYSQTGSAQPVLLYTGMSATVKSHSFKLGTKMGIVDGANFLIYNGTAVSTAASQAYIPTQFIGVPPTGGGVKAEDLNLMSPSWKQKSSTFNTVLTYKINGAPIDAVESLKLNGVTLTNPTNYTVNLTTGIITLVANPGETTNGLEIQVRKAAAIDSTRITKCRVAAVYGGPSDSKVFLTGNPDYPHIDFWTGLPLSGAYDPTYWPDTNYDRVGGDDDPVVGYAVQHDQMIVAKRDSMYRRSWEFVTDAYDRTVMRFPSVNLNAGRGAYSARSIQLLENEPFFLSDLGVYRVQSTQVRDERNVKPASTLTGILASGDGESIDFGNKYYLSLANGRVWVCDYLRTLKDEANGDYQPVWFPWDNLPVSTWAANDTDLFFGSSADGMVYRMKKKSDPLPYNDNGAAIPCYFTSIFTTFDRDDMTKLVQSLIIAMKMGSKAEIKVEYATEEGASGVIHIERAVLMDFSNVDFSDFSFDTSRLPKAFKVRVDDARNIQQFQLKLSSSGVVDEFFGFSSINIKYQTLSEVR